MTKHRPGSHAAARLLRASTLTAAVAVSLLLVAACTSTDDAGDPATEPAAGSASEPAAGSAAGSVAPASAPADWQAVDQGPLTIHVPATFVESEPLASDSAPAGVGEFVWIGPKNAEGRSPGVTTTVTDNPTRPAATEAKAMEDQQNATRGVEDFTTAEIDWPGAEAATYLAYEADATDAQDVTVRYRYEWVMADLSGGQQVLVGAVAPLADFDELEIHRILTSIDLTS